MCPAFGCFATDGPVCFEDCMFVDDFCSDSACYSDCTTCQQTYVGDVLCGSFSYSYACNSHSFGSFSFSYGSLFLDYNCPSFYV